jgi:hypothetical protein
VTRVRRTTLDLPENRRIAGFLRRLWSDVEGVAGVGILRGEDLDRLLTAQRDIGTVMATTFFGDLAATEGESAVRETSTLERDDVRYARLHQLRVRYLTEVVPTGDVDQIERQHTARPDEIYQALCMLLLAAAFGMERGRDAQGRACWTSREWVMYVNLAGVLPSWRANTARPDDYRADFVLLSRVDPTRCILLDAKASVDAGGHVPGERVKEVQAYLNAFGLHRAGILFPGPMHRATLVQSEDISARGFLLSELPVRAVEPHELAVMLNNLRTRVLDLVDESSFVEDE